MDQISGAGHTTYMYWEDGQRKDITDPLNRVWHFGLQTFTSTSSQLVETLNSGDTVTTTYDPLGHPVTASYSTPTGQGLDAT